VKVEDDVRVTMSQSDSRNTQKTDFINNTNTRTLKDGSSTTKERVALSKLLKPQADN
jgi:phosphopantothenoylcysteine synthetase/decarboxylase